jgi:hypothetical protein
MAEQTAPTSHGVMQAPAVIPIPRMATSKTSVPSSQQVTFPMKGSSFTSHEAPQAPLFYPADLHANPSFPIQANQGICKLSCKFGGLYASLSELAIPTLGAANHMTSLASAPPAAIANMGNELLSLTNLANLQKLMMSSGGMSMLSPAALLQNLTSSNMGAAAPQYSTAPYVMPSMSSATSVGGMQQMQAMQQPMSQRQLHPHHMQQPIQQAMSQMQQTMPQMQQAMSQMQQQPMSQMQHPGQLNSQQERVKPAKRKPVRPRSQRDQKRQLFHNLQMGMKVCL